MLHPVICSRRNAALFMCFTAVSTSGCSPVSERSNEPMARSEFMLSHQTFAETTRPAEPAAFESPAPAPETVPVLVIPPPAERAEPVERERTAPIARMTAPAPTHPAALSLLNEATRQEDNGEYERAAAKLERALRIEPRNATLWNRLANIRLRQGQNQLAANLAAKSNSYAASDSELVELNQRIIANSKKR